MLKVLLSMAASKIIDRGEIVVLVYIPSQILGRDMELVNFSRLENVLQAPFSQPTLQATTTPFGALITGDIKHPALATSSPQVLRKFGIYLCWVYIFS